MTDEDFLFHLKEEIKFARKKFPKNAHLCVALQEEVGELSEALLEGRGIEGGLHGAHFEAVQVACVAMRIATEGDGDFPNVKV